MEPDDPKLPRPMADLDAEDVEHVIAVSELVDPVLIELSKGDAEIQMGVENWYLTLCQTEPELATMCFMYVSGVALAEAYRNQRRRGRHR